MRSHEIKLPSSFAGIEWKQGKEDAENLNFSCLSYYGPPFAKCRCGCPEPETNEGGFGICRWVNHHDNLNLANVSQKVTHIGIEVMVGWSSSVKAHVLQWSCNLYVYY